MKLSSERVINWRKRTKRKLIVSMGDKCQICGYTKCDEALEFHHLDPTKKDFSFGAIRANPKKINSVINELKKCILLCSNCHREIHYGKVSLPTEYNILDENLIKSEYELRQEIKRHNGYIGATLKVPEDRRKIKLSKNELIELLNEYNGNKSALARYLNVSETAIRKKLIGLLV